MSQLVKLFAQHGSTFPLFRGHSCVAQQSRVHLRSNAQRVELPSVSIGSLNISNILQDGNGKSPLLPEI